MKKCLKITFSYTKEMEKLAQGIQKHAQKQMLEGTIQAFVPDNLIKIMVHGDKDSVESFLDMVHKEAAKLGIADVVAESQFKEKDYRGVFRIIE